MLKSRSEDDRRIFRESLVNTILTGRVLELTSVEQRQFIDQLSQSWIVIPSARETDRIRSLKKVASDSRRLKQALARLSSTDSALLNDGFQHTVPLSSRIALLEETAASAESTVASIQGRQRTIRQLQQGYAGSRLIKVLELHHFPCSTRNDHEKRLVESRLGDGSSKRKRNYDYLPNLDCGATLAMRCTMLAMFDAGVVELDWSATVAVIKSGDRFQKALNACDQNIRETRFALLRGLAEQRQLIEHGMVIPMLCETSDSDSNRSHCS